MAYDVTTWAKAKAYYETGNYSIPEVGEKLGILHTAIENKIAQEGWIKGKNKEKIEAGIAERNIEMFAKLGMTQENVAEKIIEGVFLPDATAKKLAEYIQNNNPENEEGEKNDDYFKQMAVIVKEMVNDKYLSLKYIQEFNKMCGTLAPFKKELTGKEGSPLHSSNMTKEQIVDILRRIAEK